MKLSPRVAAQGPASIRDVEELEDLLSEPSPGTIETLSRLEGDLIVLGVGGKMGPTLARMAQRAYQAAGLDRRVIGVSRFNQPGLQQRLESQGIQTISADLLEPAQVDALPDAPNVVAMTGMKFGTSGQASLTWAMNAWLPATICRKFSAGRIVAFSSGNVYALAPVTQGGSREDDAVQPVGEYAMSALGRERIYEHFSRTFGIPLALVRLNYAQDLRYGVLVDIACRVLEGQAIDLAMGHFNAVWQGDANAMTLQCFDHVSTGPFVLNVAGPETLSVRRVAERFGELFDRPAQVTGSEAPDALVSNAQLSHRLFGYPRVSTEQMIHWIADWVRRGGDNLGKPTHFETRDGRY